MADITNLSQFLSDVADAIRTKKETTEPIPAENFDQEILSIETGIDTSDATATANDIISSKTAYVNGEKITGVLNNNGSVIYNAGDDEISIANGVHINSKISPVDITTLSKYHNYYNINAHILRDMGIPYTKIEYLQSSGTQLIDTGIQIRKNITFEICVQLTKPNTSDYMFGGADDFAKNAIAVCNISSNGYNMYPYIGTGNYDCYVQSNIADKHIYRYEKGLFKSDGVTKVNRTSISNFTSTNNFGIFGAIGLNKGKIKFYYCKIWDEDMNLVRNFIPVKDSNGIGCLYDFITGRFYYDTVNQEQFIVGADILDTSVDDQLDIISAERDNKILPENIKAGITCLGVTGTLTQGEDLQEQLNAQDLIIQQLQEELAGKASGGEVKPNVFMQEDEPTTKDGIWLKGNYPVDNIVADENVFAREEWNTTKMANLKAIPYNFYEGSVAVSIGTDIYLLGGNGNSRTAYKYDTLTDTYTKLTDIPYNFYEGSAVAVGTNVYLFGGNGNSRIAYKYDTLTGTYTKLTDIPYNFYRGSAVSIGTDIYLFGSSNNSYYTTAYKYDTLTDTYTQLTNIPYYFYYGSAVSIRTDIYLFGSGNSSYCKYTYKYDTLTGTYTKLTNIPYDFDRGSAVSIETNVYLLGSSGSPTTAYKYDTLTDTYTQLTNIPYSLYYGSAVFTGTDVYLFGGSVNKTKVQVMSMIPNDYGNNSIVISQGGFTKKTNIANYGIQNAKFYYERVYYQNENGELLNTIPTYNGNGTEWVKISGGEE